MDGEAGNYAPSPESFEEFFRVQYPRLGKAMYVLTSSRAEAEDIAQEAMARVLERWERVSVMDSPEGYAYRVAMNLFLRHTQERARLADLPDAAEFSDLGAAAAGAERRVEIHRALASLTPEQRAAIVLVNLIGFSVDETAEILEIEPVSVRARIHRARTSLRMEGGAW